MGYGIVCVGGVRLAGAMGFVADSAEGEQKTRLEGAALCVGVMPKVKGFGVSRL